MDLKGNVWIDWSIKRLFGIEGDLAENIRIRIDKKECGGFKMNTKGSKGYLMGIR